MRFVLFVLCTLVLATRAGAGEVSQIPKTQPATVFAAGLVGPEGLAFNNDGMLVVGSSTGQIRRYLPDGTSRLWANVGERLAGITVLLNDHVLACSFTARRVWDIQPNGIPRIFVENIPGPNVIVETRLGRIYVSASSSGQIIEITGGTAIVRASGLNFPNGMAIGRDHYLYVAETGGNRVSRLLINRNGTLGAPAVYADGLPFADGIAFDRKSNLLVVGSNQLRVVERQSRTALTMPADMLFNGPSNIAFGRGRGFSRRDFYLANFGTQFGNGTNVLQIRFNHFGTRLIR